MATTRIISMYVSHGKTIADCLTDRIDYLSLIHISEPTRPY